MSKVLLVGKGFPDRGGIPTFLNTLRHGELGELHQITFLNVAHFDTPEGGEVTAGNISRTLRDARNVFRMAKGQDIVHIHSALAPAVTVGRAGLLALAGRLRGAKVVMHAHGGNIETWLTTRRTRTLMRLAMKPTSHVVAVWSAGEQTLGRALGPGRVSLIDNGVDTSRFVPAETDNHPPRVLYVGLLTPRKGVLDLIEASRLLRDEGVEHERPPRRHAGRGPRGRRAGPGRRRGRRPAARAPGRRRRCPRSSPTRTCSACRPGGRRCRYRSWRRCRPDCPWCRQRCGDVSGLVTSSAERWCRPRTRALARALRGWLTRSCGGGKVRQQETSDGGLLEPATARAIDQGFHDVRQRRAAERFSQEIGKLAISRDLLDTSG